jgi:hypothetical protein
MKISWNHLKYLVLAPLIPLLVAGSCDMKIPPTILSFRATPNSLTAPGDVKLEWQVENATEVSISPDIGVVNGTSKTVNLNSSKTFTLTAKNAQNSVTKDLTVQLTPSNQAVLFDTTKVADTSTRTALKSFDAASGELVFSQSTPTLEKLQVGDVIASEPSSVAENGYLRKITGIQPDGAGFKVQSEPATLLEAIKQGEIHYDAPLEPSTLKSATPAMPGVRLIQTKAACLGYCYEAVLNAELCLTDACAEAKIKLEGNVKFSMGIKLDSKWSCCVPPLDWVEASFGVSEQANFKITGNLKGAVNKRIRIATYAFDPIIISLGIPLVFIPSVSVYVGVDGSASVNVEYGIKQSLGFRVGARWENKKGWSAIKDFTPTITQDPAPSLRGTAKVFTYAEVEPKISLYGIADIQAYLKVGPELEAGYPRNPLWNLRAKASGGFKFGVTIPIIDKEYKYDQELFNFNIDIAKAGNESPVISQVPPGVSDVAAVKGIWLYLNGNPASFPSSSFQIKAFDPEDGENISFSANSDRDGLLVQEGDVYKLSPKSLGIHNITVTVKDSAGLSATSSFQVNVTAGKPSVDAKVPTATVVAGTEVSIAYSGQNGDSVELFPPPLFCNQLVWSVTSPDEIVAQSNSGTQTQCAATLRFNTAGTRTISLSATDNWNQTSTKNFSVTVQEAGPVVINYIKVKCANLEIPEGGPCRYIDKLNASAKATGPQGSSLTYSWSLESQNSLTEPKIPLQEDIGVPLGDATTAVSLPKKALSVEINPNPCGLTPDGQHFYDTLTLEVSDSINTSSRSFYVGCFAGPK